MSNNFNPNNIHTIYHAKRAKQGYIAKRKLSDELISIFIEYNFKNYHENTLLRKAFRRAGAIE